jgi:hypothetical protein
MPIVGELASGQIDFINKHHIIEAGLGEVDAIHRISDRPWVNSNSCKVLLVRGMWVRVPTSEPYFAQPPFESTLGESRTFKVHLVKLGADEFAVLETRISIRSLSHVGCHEVRSSILTRRGTRKSPERSLSQVSILEVHIEESTVGEMAPSNRGATKENVAERSGLPVRKVKDCE